MLKAHDIIRLVEYRLHEAYSHNGMVMSDEKSTMRDRLIAEVRVFTLKQLFNEISSKMEQELKKR